MEEVKAPLRVQNEEVVTRMSRKHQQQAVETRRQMPAVEAHHFWD